MLKTQIVAFALLAATATLAGAQDTAKKDPKTGKDCVTFFSSELTQAGQVRMNFRNTCASPFQIRIATSEKDRQNSIDPGTPASPSKAFVTCKQDDSCESAKWQYE